METIFICDNFHFDHVSEKVVSCLKRNWKRTSARQGNQVFWLEVSGLRWFTLVRRNEPNSPREMLSCNVILSLANNKLRWLPYICFHKALMLMNSLPKWNRWKIRVNAGRWFVNQFESLIWRGASWSCPSLKTSALETLYGGQFYSINSADKTKSLCYALPSTQHRDFFRNLPTLSLWFVTI